MEVLTTDNKYYQVVAIMPEKHINDVIRIYNSDSHKDAEIKWQEKLKRFGRFNPYKINKHAALCLLGGLGRAKKSGSTLDLYQAKFVILTEEGPIVETVKKT